MDFTKGNSKTRFAATLGFLTVLLLGVSAGARASDQHVFQPKDDKSRASLQETAEWLVDTMSRYGCHQGKAGGFTYENVEFSGTELTYTEKWTNGIEKTFVVPCEKLDPSVLTVDCYCGAGEGAVDLECQAGEDDIKASDDTMTMLVPICFTDRELRDKAARAFLHLIRLCRNGVPVPKTAF